MVGIRNRHPHREPTPYFQQDYDYKIGTPHSCSGWLMIFGRKECYSQQEGILPCPFILLIIKIIHSFCSILPPLNLTNDKLSAFD